MDRTVKQPSWLSRRRGGNVVTANTFGRKKVSFPRVGLVPACKLTLYSPAEGASSLPSLFCSTASLEEIKVGLRRETKSALKRNENSPCWKFNSQFLPQLDSALTSADLFFLSNWALYVAKASAREEKRLQHF